MKGVIALKKLKEISLISRNNSEESTFFSLSSIVEKNVYDSLNENDEEDIDIYNNNINVISWENILKNFEDKYNKIYLQGISYSMSLSMCFFLML